MVSELTGMDVANASLLDEATGAAEAMGLCFRMHEDPDDGVFYVDKFCHPQNIAVVKTRAKFLGIKVEEVDLQTCDLSDTKVLGVLLQYPDTEGRVEDISKIIQRTHDAGGLVAVASDLIALVALKPPGDLGADICLGNAQRMGVPLGYGGPHAGFFAVKKNLLKSLPGRLVGQTRDAYDNVIYRLALQPREQHIKKDKANSNICTAQALLANMSALYAVYHGPEGLKMIVKRIHHCAMVLAEALRLQGHLVHPGTIFDTVRVTCNTDVADVFKIQRRAHERRINLRYFEDNSIGVSLDETVSAKDMEDLMYVFCCSDEVKTAVINCDQSLLTKGSYIGTNLERESPFLTHPVFNKYHSEQMLVRYMKKLENKDLSLVHSMIPLGSCTMKLNATTECIPLVMPEFSDIHPFAPIDQAQGYQELLEELERDLCEITGYDKISFQPNSGAQGEYAGLCTIRSYLEAKGEDQRKVALIPMSAHGTNPASAKMAGLNVVYLKTNKNGEVTVDAWKESIDEHKKYLACIMVTYPSTNGIFEDTIREICDSVHEAGGQVYVDGANMNAQVGLCRPGDYGSDVSHLNLHKTFCIPHGGGGPGMGPIGV
jgi:glycine dehydrogenase